MIAVMHANLFMMYQGHGAALKSIVKSLGPRDPSLLTNIVCWQGGLSQSQWWLWACYWAAIRGAIASKDL